MDTLLTKKHITPVSKKILLLQEASLLNLKPSEQEKVLELKERLKDVVHTDGNGYSLLKWLKARKFDVLAAEKMFRSSIEWREKLSVDRLLKEFKVPEVLKDYYIFSRFGFDREGSPILYLILGSFDPKGLLSCVKKGEILKVVISKLESCVSDFKSQSEKEGRLVETVTVIIDADNFNIKSALWKPAFDLYIQALGAYEANYPETLKTVLLINAPKIFSVFYTLIKPILSEQTRNKVNIYSRDNWKEDLLKCVDPDQLPLHWGGNLTDEVDGNPYCSSKISMGGEVPHIYYHAQEPKVPLDMQNTTIGLKNTFKLELNVEKPYSVLSWFFKTDDHDIAFGIMFEDLNTKDKNGNSSAFYLLPIERVNCYLVPEEGNIICNDVGKYTLIFDNSFSWLTSKKLMYNVQVSPPLKPENINED